jgi:hypothetical protein
MNTLWEAVGEYLEMRCGLGFKLQEAGKRLINFITLLEQHNASTRVTSYTAKLYLWFRSNFEVARSKRLCSKPT